MSLGPHKFCKAVVFLGNPRAMKSRPLLGVFPLLLTLAIAPEPMGFALQREYTVAHSYRSPAPIPTPFPPPQEVPQGTALEVDGSRSLILLNETLRQQFEEEFPGTDLRMVAEGTPDALDRLRRGDVDLVAIGRPLSGDEKDEGLAELPLRREKIALIVSKDNPFQGQISFDQFARIVWGDITNWKQLGGPDRPIRFIDRPETSDTRQSLRYYDIFAGKVRTGKTAVPIDGDETAGVVDALGRDGIGYALYSQVKDNPDVRIVKMHGVSADSPLYPYSQSQGYVYRKGDVSEGAQAFLGWATSESGKEAVATARMLTWSQLPTEVLEANAAQSGGDRPNKPSGTATTNSDNEEPATGATSASGDRPAEPSGTTTATAPTTGTTSDPTTTAPDANGSDANFPWWIFLLPLLLAGVLLLLRRRDREASPPTRAIASPPPPEALPAATNPAVDFTPPAAPEPLPTNPSETPTPAITEPPPYPNGAGLAGGAAITGFAGTTFTRESPKPATPLPRPAPTLPDPWETPPSPDAVAETRAVANDATDVPDVATPDTTEAEPVGMGDAPSEGHETIPDASAEAEMASATLEDEGVNDAAVLAGAGAIAAAVLATAIPPSDETSSEASEDVEMAHNALESEAPPVVADVAETHAPVGHEAEQSAHSKEVDSLTETAALAGVALTADEAETPSKPTEPTSETTNSDGESSVVAEPVHGEGEADLAVTAALAGAAIASDAVETQPDEVTDAHQEGEEDLAVTAALAGAAIATDAVETPSDEAEPVHAEGEADLTVTAALAGAAIASDTVEAPSENSPESTVAEAAIAPDIPEAPLEEPFESEAHEAQGEQNGYTVAAAAALTGMAIASLKSDEAIAPEQEDVAPEAVEGTEADFIPMDEVTPSPSPEDGLQLVPLDSVAPVEEPTTEYLTVDNRANCFVLDPLRMQQMQELAVRYPLDSGHYKIFIESGSFDYQANSGHPGEPWVLLWIYGGRFINQKTRVPVSATWSTLNGYHDSLTLEVLEPTTLAALFIDTYKGDNEGELTLSIEQLSPPSDS